MSTLSIASYNVLADAYVRPDRFAHVAPRHLDPAWRRPALVRHVADLGADVVCLQEVEQPTFDAIATHLGERGYEGRLERKGLGKPDGCAVFLRTGSFGLRSVRALRYADGAGGPDSGHLALIVELNHDGRPLTVATTHLRWDPPGRPAAEQIGLRQIRELLDAVGPAGGAALVVCGDLNVIADSEVTAALREHGLQDAYAGTGDTFTCNANGRGRRIDFIFHSRVFSAQPAPLAPISGRTPLPRGDEPSDHLAVAANLHWKDVAAAP